MASQSSVILTAGNLRLELSPSVGGAISEFRMDRRRHRRGRYCANATVAWKMSSTPQAFRSCPTSTASAAADSASAGARCGLRRTWPATPARCTARAGSSRGRSRKHSDTTATLSFQHSAGEWPWDYEARQEFALDERGLSLRLTCRNTSAEPMPCGLGQHPYFPCGPDTRLDTQVTHAWTIDEQVLPVDKVPAEGRYDLRDRLVCGQDLDNGFGGWGGEARMTDPDWPYDLEMSSPDAALLPALFAAERRHLRRRAGDPRQCRAQRAGGANGRSSGCACSSRARRWASTCGSRSSPK